MSKTIKRKAGAASRCGALLAQRPYLLMQGLANDGWCVTLKVMPRALPWLVETAPGIGNGKWLAEATDLRWAKMTGERMRRSESSMGAKISTYEKAN